MYIPSSVRLTLKKGTSKHNDRVFVNKARVGEGVENDAAGMEALGKALAKAKVDDRTMFCIGRGETPVPEVVEGMVSGEVLAFQYHREGYDQPSWKIGLGFITDVDAKNAEYAAKKTGKKTKKSVKKSTAKGSLIS